MNADWIPNPFAIPRTPEATCRNCGHPIAAHGRSRTGWRHTNGQHSTVTCPDGSGDALPELDA